MSSNNMYINIHKYIMLIWSSNIHTVEYIVQYKCNVYTVEAREC